MNSVMGLGQKLGASVKTILFLALILMSQVSMSQDLDDEFSREADILENTLEEKDKPTAFDELDIMRRVENIGNGNEGNLVIVEPRNIIPVQNTNKLEMIPYRIRRKDWGHVWGVSYGLYTPNNYSPDQFELLYEDIYPSGGDLGLLQLEIILKRNYEAFSLGGYFSVGYFGVESDTDVAAELTVVPIKLGFYGSLDTLWREPWIVPYAHGGIYSTYFDETTQGNSFNGTTLLAFYVAGGVMMQLDWVDDSSAREAYMESGIENTFIFLEANYLSVSVEEKDPEFDALYVSAGVKVEF